MHDYLNGAIPSNSLLQLRIQWNKRANHQSFEGLQCHWHFLKAYVFYVLVQMMLLQHCRDVLSYGFVHVGSFRVVFGVHNLQFPSSKMN